MIQWQVVVISKDPEFSDLTGVTEAYVPAAGVFVGEHPLLRRYAIYATTAIYIYLALYKVNATVVVLHAYMSTVYILSIRV
jgi:hypothetical protein